MESNPGYLLKSFLLYRPSKRTHSNSKDSFVLFRVPLNPWQDWKAKLERTYYFMFQSCKITVCSWMTKVSKVRSYFKRCIVQSLLDKIFITFHLMYTEVNLKIICNAMKILQRIHEFTYTSIFTIIIAQKYRIK